ncbi:hypothetical protein [Thermoproteus uzoniensis]|uniref:hypothetical protein n=1 Tax=Thermoproteus uzoniensis TaxID=184117 RepID=UPI0013051D34|nr:hypothetical protein [Thermoproteus uzoniensis]
MIQKHNIGHKEGGLVHEAELKMDTRKRVLTLGLEFLIDEPFPIIMVKIAKRLGNQVYAQLRITRILDVTQPMINKMLTLY